MAQQQPTEAEAVTSITRHLINAADLPGLERLRDALTHLISEVDQRANSITLAETANPPSAGRKTVRVLLPGCFDMMHAGHYNALRQAKAVCSGEGVDVILVAGVHNDAAILEQKGPTVFKDQERIALVTGCKWVDEVAVDLPYLITPGLLDSLDCDYVAHGDDLPTRSDGTSVYGSVIAAGRFKLIKRTEGVSTTTLIGRLLSMSKDHLLRNTSMSAAAGERAETDVLSCHSTMLPTMSRLTQFKSGRSREDAHKLVYVDGAFDLFHVGHMQFLKKARECGDYLLVGVHTDQVIHTVKGRNFPVQDMCERALCVLAMQCVDDIIIGAPWEISEEMVKSLGISVVVCGTIAKDTVAENSKALPDAYSYPREINILTEIDSGSGITTEDVIDRILSSRDVYMSRNATRSVMEDTYKANKEYVTER